jgi:hypothetical protein
MDNEISIVTLEAITEFLEKYKKNKTNKHNNETKTDIINYILKNIKKLSFKSNIECENCKADNYYYDW